METSKYNQPYYKFLNKLLHRLLKLDGVNGWKLTQNHDTCLSAGMFQGDEYERSFNEFNLIIAVEPGSLTPEIERHIKSHRKLARVISNGLSSDSAIKSSYLINSYLEILLLVEERIHRLNFYEKILHLNKEILLANDLFAVLQSIMDMSCKACHGEASSLLLVDKKTGEMYFNVVSGENKTELQEIRIPAGEGIAGSVVTSAQPEIIRDVSLDNRSFQRVDEVLNHETKNMIIAPIVAHENVIGVIEVINSKRDRGFVAEDLDFLINIAGHTSLFIENIKAKEDLLTSNRNLDRKNSEINTLYEIGQALNTSLDPTELKIKLLTTLLKIMNIKYIEILEFKNKSLSRTCHGQKGEKVLFDSTDTFAYISSTDIILWLKNYKEPFLFQQPDGTQNALAERFLISNEVTFKSHFKPDLWIPVFDDDNEVLFIISLSGSKFNREAPVSDMKFFHGVMNTCFTVFQNVRSFKNALESKRKEEHIRKGFQKYVPARVISSLLEEEDPDPVQQEVSVLFADIRGFTHLTEVLEPYKLVNLLNQYFEVMVEAITIHGGIVDKFMGDSIMAIFGLPDSTPDDAQNALDAAAEMLKRLKTIILELETSNQLSFQMGIGLHSGQVIAGNIGSHNRTDYTIIGDTVNLAARLEKAVKYYKIPMLFTGDTKKSANNIPCREIDLIKVRGRSASVNVFEPLYNVANATDSTAFLEKWHKGIQTYRDASFDQALQYFQEIKKDNSIADPVCEIYIDRCNNMIQSPDPDFDGVFDLL